MSSGTLAGTYLFRVASSGSGLSLSLKVPAKVCHFKISKTTPSGLWHLVGKPEAFATIAALVECYTTSEYGNFAMCHMMFTPPIVVNRLARRRRNVGDAL